MNVGSADIGDENYVEPISKMLLFQKSSATPISQLVVHTAEKSKSSFLSA